LGRQADDRLIEAFQRCRMPLVNLDKPTGERTCVHVGPDNAHGAQLLTEHLLQHGHTRIAYLGGPSISAATRERRDGFLASMAQHGLPVAAEYIRYGLFTEESGYEVMQELLNLAVLPTAIMAASDSMAVGAIAAAREQGICVPREMAVTGFDDVPLAALSQPPLTTVRQPIRRIGFEAVRKLLALIDGQPDVRSEMFPVELMVRQSCGCA
jgi:LacI family transcriptional regulator